MTPSIQRILNRDTLSSLAAYGLKIGGAVCYVLTLKGTGITVVYNVQSGKWSEWTQPYCWHSAILHDYKERQRGNSR